MAERVYNKGEVIFKKGEDGNSFFRIIDGTVSVVINENSDEPLTQAGVGDFFGEMAVLEGFPRSATLIANDDRTVVLEIPGESLEKYFKEDPQLIIDLMKHLGARIRELTEEYHGVLNTIDEVKNGAPKDEGLMKRIGKYIAYHLNGRAKIMRPSLEALKGLEEAEHGDGFAKKVEAVKAGTIIFKEGDESPCMYDIHGGRVGIYVSYGTEKEQLLTELYSNAFFGEMGMIDGVLRSATAVAIDDNTIIETIFPEDFEELFSKNPTKVWMILLHLSHRLRGLTDDFAAACAELNELNKA